MMLLEIISHNYHITSEHTLLFGVMLLCAEAVPAVANASDDGKADTATKVICNVIVFVQKLGLPIMTGVILGASIMAIFGKLAWAAIVMLVVFTAIFFGASKLIQKFAAGLNGDFQGAEQFECLSGGNTKKVLKND